MVIRVLLFVPRSLGFLLDNEIGLRRPTLEPHPWTDSGDVFKGILPSPADNPADTNSLA